VAVAEDEVRREASGGEEDNDDKDNELRRNQWHETPRPRTQRTFFLYEA
jgi:hypothetical protein